MRVSVLRAISASALLASMAGAGLSVQSAWASDIDRPGACSPSFEWDGGVPLEDKHKVPDWFLERD